MRRRTRQWSFLIPPARAISSRDLQAQILSGRSLPRNWLHFPGETISTSKIKPRNAGQLRTPSWEALRNKVGPQVRAETCSVCRKLAAESLFKRELISNAVSRGVL